MVQFSFLQPQSVFMGEGLLRSYCLLLATIATANNPMPKIRPAGCTQVDRWIDLGIFSLPIDSLNFGRSLLNRPRFQPSMACLNC